MGDLTRAPRGSAGLSRKGHCCDPGEMDNHPGGGAVTTLDQLRAIPDLAALVFVAAATPYREPGEHRRGKITGSPMPPEVAAWDMLNPDGLLHELTQAVRMVWEQQDARRPLANPPTFAGECSWLVETADEWQPDPLMREWVRDTAANVHRALARWVGETPAAPLECTKCRGTVSVDTYDATGDEKRVACSDCGHIWTRADLAHEAVMRTPASLPDIAVMLGVTARTAQRWASVVQPVTDHEPTPHAPALYLPADLERIAAMVKAPRVEEGSTA